MADTSQKNNVAEQFSALPENIRKWLASEELVFIISEIETKLGLSDEKILVIPHLILRLVTQDLAPQNFINELSKELGVDFLVAKTITEDIEKNALRPIAAELRDKLGLEVKLVYYGKSGEEKSSSAPAVRSAFSPAPAVTASTQPTSSKVIPPPAQIKLEKQVTPSPSAAPALFQSAADRIPAAPSVTPIPQPFKKAEPVFESATPFILHQEGSPTTAPTLNQNSSITSQQGPQTSSLPKTSLTMKVQNYFQSAGIPERPISKPISIKVEAPAAQQAITQAEQKIPVMKQSVPPVAPVYAPIAPKEQPRPAASPIMPAQPAASPAGQPRVVNYSNLRTPVNNLGLPKKEVDRDNVVDLRKFS